MCDWNSSSSTKSRRDFNCANTRTRWSPLFAAEKGKKAKLEAEKKEQEQGKGEGGGEQQQFQQQSAPMKQILNGLDELWAQSQYDEEFDVEQFQKTFSSGKK